MSIKFVATHKAAREECEKTIKANAQAQLALLDEIGGKEETPEQTEKLAAFTGAIEAAEKERENLDKRAAVQAEVRRKYIDLAPEAEQPEKVPAEPKQPRWRAFGEFMKAVQASSGEGARRDPRLEPMAAVSGSSVQVPSDGGYLVQENFATELMRKANDVGKLMGMCRKVPITNGNSIVFNQIDETSRADGSRGGGVQGYWAGEAAQFTGTKPKLRKQRLEVNKLTALWYATDELLADAPAMEAIAMTEFADEIAFKVEDAIINGDGAGKPVGILRTATPTPLISVSKETGQAAATVVAANIIKMRARMWARSRPNSVWLYNQECDPQLHQMTLAVGTGGIPVYMPANGLADDGYDRLYGRPVIPTEYNAALGTVGDIMLVDMNQYMLATKGGVEIASSMHLRFDYNEMVFRLVFRVDGQPAWHTALTPYKGSATISPFVALATRA